MLPDKRFALMKSTEDNLKKLKNYTGIAPITSSRIAFFRSIETEFRYNKDQNIILDGSLSFDKYTWLGETRTVVELVLKMYYPDFDSEQYPKAWAAHVEDGIAAIRNCKGLSQFSIEL